MDPLTVIVSGGFWPAYQGLFRTSRHVAQG